ncbi:hypothetical protein [Paenibacillus agaridevorans]|uniref:hypothetical protein n=1 Tax=Paenibacillus agaridevorans TaxID=171404 RepID=UPI001BE4178C|nr:hypothetical protein [Paenibacillus agaridevorans]
MIFNKPIGQFDFVLQSKDRKSNIVFTLIDFELNRLPSINYLVSIKDREFSGEVNIWIDNEVFIDFYERLKEANLKRTGNFNIRSMTPEELEMNLISQRKGSYEIEYSIKKNSYLDNRLIETVLKGAFEYDTEFLNQLEEKLKDIKKFMI